MGADIGGRNDPPSWIGPGRILVWRHKPRGGYGFVFRHVVTVVSGTDHSARVRIRLQDGREVTVPRSSLVDGDRLERGGIVSAEPPEVSRG